MIFGVLNLSRGTWQFLCPQTINTRCLKKPRRILTGGMETTLTNSECNSNHWKRKTFARFAPSLGQLMLRIRWLQNVAPHPCILCYAEHAYFGQQVFFESLCIIFISSCNLCRPIRVSIQIGFRNVFAYSSKEWTGLWEFRVNGLSVAGQGNFGGSCQTLLKVFSRFRTWICLSWMLRE